MGSRIQLQQRNCSRISREFLAPVHTNYRNHLRVVATALWAVRTRLTEARLQEIAN